MLHPSFTPRLLLAAVSWVVVLQLPDGVEGQTVNQALEAEIALKEKVVRDLADKVEQLHQERCTKFSTCQCSSDACTSGMFGSTPSNPAGGTCDESLSRPERCGADCVGIRRDFVKSIMNIPASEADSANMPKRQEAVEAMCFSMGLEPDFKINLNNNPELDIQFFGSWTGVFRKFPGEMRASEDCGKYDPRFRPWYVAASSGSKDIVIIIDVSGSMERHNRLTLAKEAAKAVVSTLGFSDYFDIVAFHTTATSWVKGISSHGLVNASNNNKELAAAWIDRLQLGGQTNFEAAFTTGVKSLTDGELNERSSGCSRAILFLSDGDITQGVGQNQAHDDFLTLLDNLMPEDIILFSYALGANADVQLSRKMSCQHKGVHSTIEDGGDLRTQMALYYDYFAMGYAMHIKETDERPVVWIDPYVWASSGIIGTDAAAPAFDRSTTPPTLIGVVATGLTVDRLQEMEPDYNSLINRLKYQKCRLISLAECELESLRGRFSSDSLCGTCSGQDPLEVHPRPCQGTGPSKIYCNNYAAGLGNANVCCAECDLPECQGPETADLPQCSGSSFVETVMGIAAAGAAAVLL